MEITSYAGFVINTGLYLYAAIFLFFPQSIQILRNNDKLQTLISTLLESNKSLPAYASYASTAPNVVFLYKQCNFTNGQLL